MNDSILASITATTLSRMQTMRETSKALPAGVSASKMTRRHHSLNEGRIGSDSGSFSAISIITLATEGFSANPSQAHPLRTRASFRQGAWREPTAPYPVRNASGRQGDESGGSMLGFATKTLLPVKEPAKQTEPLET